MQDLSPEARARVLQSATSTCRIECVEYLVTLEKSLFSEASMRKTVVAGVLAGSETVPGDKARCFDLLMNLRMPLSVDALEWVERRDGSLDYRSTALRDSLLHVAAVNGQADVVEALLHSERFSRVFDANVFGHRAVAYALKDPVWRALRAEERAHGFALRRPEFLVSWAELQQRAATRRGSGGLPEVSVLVALLEAQHVAVDTCAESDFPGHLAVGATAGYLLKAAAAAGIKPARTTASSEVPAHCVPFLADVDLHQLSTPQRLAAVQHLMRSISVSASPMEIPLTPHWVYAKARHTVSRQSLPLGPPLRPVSTAAAASGRPGRGA